MNSDRHAFREEPTVGRTHDGENYQNGFVDVAYTPYTETVQAAREIGYHLYEIRRTLSRHSLS